MSKSYRAELYYEKKKIGSYPFRVIPPKEAEPAEIKVAVLARDVTNDWQPVDATENFQPTDTVYLAVRADVGLQTWIQTMWYVDKKLDVKGTRSLTYKENRSDAKMSFSFIPEGGWPPGQHEVVITLNDEQTVRRRFTVDKARPKKIASTKQAIPVPPIKDPKTAKEFNQRGEWHFEAGRYDEALADFSRALKLAPGTAEFMSNRGWVYYQQDDPETAMLEFDEAIEQDPTFVLAYWGRAAVRSGEGEWDAAIKDYSQAIRNSSDKRELAELYTERGDTNHSAGNVRKALRDFERATQKDPDYAQAHGSRANVLLEEEAFDEALKAITNAIKLDGELHNLLGDIYTAQENLEPSLAAYTAAINCDDENAMMRMRSSIAIEAFRTGSSRTWTKQPRICARRLPWSRTTMICSTNWPSSITARAVSARPLSNSARRSDWTTAIHSIGLTAAMPIIKWATMTTRLAISRRAWHSTKMRMPTRCEVERMNAWAN